MKFKTNIYKYLSSLFFKNKIKSYKSIDVNYDKKKFREVAKTILGHTETKSITFDYQSSIRLLYSFNIIDFSNKNKNNSEENKTEIKTEKDEKENEKIDSNFFNDYSIKILENSTKENLLDLACKSFVGDTGNN